MRLYGNKINLSLTRRRSSIIGTVFGFVQVRIDVRLILDGDGCFMTGVFISENLENIELMFSTLC